MMRFWILCLISLLHAENDCYQQEPLVCEAKQFAERYHEIASLYDEVAKQQQLYFIRRSVQAYRQAAQTSQDQLVRRDLLCQAFQLLGHYQQDQAQLKHTNNNKQINSTLEIKYMVTDIHKQLGDSGICAASWPPFVIPMLAPSRAKIQINNDFQVNLPEVKKNSRFSPVFTAGIVNVSFGVTMFGLMATGLILSTQASRQGYSLCECGCSLNNTQVQATRQKGQLGNQLAWAGGILGGLATTVGITFLVLDPPKRNQKNITISVRFAVGYPFATNLRFQF